MKVYKDVVQLSGLAITIILMVLAALIDSKVCGIIGALVGLYIIYGIPFIVSCRMGEDK